MRRWLKYLLASPLVLAIILALLYHSRSGDAPITPADLTHSAQTITENVEHARQYALASQPDAAIAELDSAIEQAQRYALPAHERARLYTLRGRMVLMLYEWDRVLDDYNIALDIAPDYAEAYFYRAILYYSAMPGGLNREDALADFEHYLRLEPDGPHAADAALHAESIRLQLEALSTP